MITKSSINKLGEVRTKVTYPISIMKDALVVAQIVTYTVSKTQWGTVVPYLQLIPCRIRCYSCPDHPVPVGLEARHPHVSELAASCSP